MTEPVTPNPNDSPAADETFSWKADHERATETGDATPGARPTGATGSTGATAILDSLREAVDDLAERATPAVREIGARAAELAAVAADRAAPFVRRAGEATSDASGRLAEKSRTWASEVRASLPDKEGTTPPPDATDVTGSGTTETPPAAPNAGTASSEGPTSPV